MSDFEGLSFHNNTGRRMMTSEEEELIDWNDFNGGDIEICKSFLKLSLVEDPIWYKINSKLVKPHVDECICFQVHYSVGVMEVEPDIENMTLEEYLNRTFDYPYYYEDIVINNYYELHPLHLCFQPPQPSTKVGFVSPNESDEVDTNSMTIAKYELYMARQIEDVERLRQILTPPNDAYDAPATNLILDELLKEFGDELLDTIVLDEKENYNLTSDIEELERLLAKDPQPYFTKIKVHSVIVKTSEEP
ncbi:hypothetical protein Tco_1194273 [Tanacetum coccineum]